MSAGPGFAAALRNFSTLFLLTFLVFAPLHLATAWHWQKAIVVAPALEAAEVAGQSPAATVDAGHVTAYRRARGVVCLAEILLLPLLVAASARVLERDDAGEVPTVPDAVRHIPDHRLNFFSKPALPALVLGALATILMVLGSSVIAARLLDVVVGADRVWPVVGLIDAVTRSVAAPFFLGSAGFAARRRGGSA